MSELREVGHVLPPRTSMRSPLLLIPAFALFTACGAPSSDGATSASSDLTDDQTGIDVQVLQVWTPGKLFPTAPQPWQGAGASDVSIHADDPAACATLRSSSTPPGGSGSHWEDREVDCTTAFANAAPFDVTHAAGPVMTPVTFTVTKSVESGVTYVDPDFCNRIEVRVVVRDAASSSPSFAGVGFWTSRGETFASKSDLQNVGHTRLANGDDATVYRFTGISTCISSAHNSTSGNEFQTFSFKPYAAYDANGNRYRVWERIPGNHTIGKSWPGEQPAVDSSGFDRQNDLLAH